ncbi:hypothetical protein CC80DRAFT_538341 [Byssothecium circinans]|uniref:Aminoglycoside phosphotransferase domain-containing protein n=1 Tax=Byssothecium circinans TaxID=147558 RepID=A0A6A5TMS9_9PLEO|nr:hypothetical protein CC80DRAFT_538341 [Byssothecium circinans]
MPMRTCDFDSCSKPAVRTTGDCILCNQHLCSSHLQAPFHQCPSWEDAEHYDPAAREAEKKEIEILFQRINRDALAARASELRNGIGCSIPALQYDRSKRSSVMGGMNYHIDIVFEDDVTECATMKFLEKTAVPTPKVFDFAVESAENPVGVGYMLVEKMAGTSLRWALLSSEQRRKIVEQLADIFIELRKYPFEKMGSLEPCSSPSSQPIVGAFARESLTDFHGEHMAPLGPYSSPREYHTCSVKLILDLILREEMYTQNPIDAYLIHRFLLDLIPSVLPSQDQQHDGQFFLKHADDKGDHILVDADYNITAIIDWEWAYTALEAIAFNSPIGMIPVNDFYNGVNTLGEEEEFLAERFENMGERSLARTVREGQLQHRFEFCCGYDMTADWQGFLGLFKGLREAVGVDQGLEWEEWKEVALERYKGDEGLERLLSKAGVVGKG